MRSIVVLIIAAALAACDTGPVVDESRSGPRPDNYEALVKSYIRENFFDPYSVRDLAIATPVHGAMYRKQGWLVCFRANAKNRMGGYAGLKITGLLIFNGKVVDTDDGPSPCDYVAWPPL